MLNPETLSAICFLTVTGVNLMTIFHLAGTGALTIGQSFIAFMIWFYGSLIVADHIWISGDEDEPDDDDLKRQ